MAALIVKGELESEWASPTPHVWDPGDCPCLWPAVCLAYPLRKTRRAQPPGTFKLERQGGPIW